jgi:hypothetical protein
MLYLVYNQCIEFLPSLALPPLDGSTPQKEVVGEMRKLLEVAIKLKVVTKEENQAVYALQYQYLSFDDLEEDAVAGAFNEIYAAFIDDFSKKSTTTVKLDPAPRWTLHAPNPFKHNHMEPAEAPSTLQAYKQADEKAESCRVLFYRYIALEKKYKAWFNDLKSQNLKNVLADQRSGTAKLIFPHLLSFAKSVDFDTLEPFMKGSKESMEMATGRIQSLPDAPSTEDMNEALMNEALMNEVLLEYAQALETVMERVESSVKKKVTK